MSALVNGVNFYLCKHVFLYVNNQILFSRVFKIPFFYSLSKSNLITPSFISCFLRNLSLSKQLCNYPLRERGDVKGSAFEHRKKFDQIRIKSECCYGLNGIPQKDMLKSYPLVSVNANVFGNSVFEDVIKTRTLESALIQYQCNVTLMTSGFIKEET